MQHCTSVSAYVRVYTKCMSVKDRYVSLRGERSDRFFSFPLPLTSIPELGKPVVTASEAVQVLSCLNCHQKVSVNSGLYLQGSSPSAFEAQELWPVNSTLNNNLMTGRRGEFYLLVPKRVQTEVKVDGKVCQMNFIISGITQKVLTYSFTYYEHSLCLT